MFESSSDERQVQVAPTASRAHLARRGRLVAAATASILVGAFAAAPSALADPPEHMRAPIGTHATFEAGELCAFTTELQRIGGNKLLTTYDNGRFHATGRVVTQVTNLDTGASTTLEINGNYDEVPQADGGSVAHAGGTFAYQFFAGDAGPGDPSTGRIWQFRGNVVMTFDPSGAVASFSSTGTSRDICAMIG
jgi:hypothetical protein